MKLLNPTGGPRHRTSLLRSLNSAAAAALDATVQTRLGALYDNPAEEKLSPTLSRLLDRTGRAIRSHCEPINRPFADGLLRSVSALRVFAISLTKNNDRAEDLVQETVLKAISKQGRFKAGTNLQAWLFTILRNQFQDAYRKERREVPDVDGSYAATLISLPDQEDRILLQDLETALAKLPQGQRDAIMLVSVEGMAYTEAARTLGCAVGTVQSRISRGRNRLAKLLDPGQGE